MRKNGRRRVTKTVTVIVIAVERASQGRFVMLYGLGFKMKEGHILLIMDDILEKLRLIDYENKFLKEKLFFTNLLNMFQVV